MRNFIFLSPNFPANYWKFCRELKNNGFRVLGIGDCPYDNLSMELKNSVHEYYRVDDLANYDAVYRAVAFFIFKYGKIDYLESNNEYWLERDAALRTAYNINSGFQTGDVKGIKYKSEMKRFYKAAGIKTARYCIATDYDTCREFIAEVNYPVIVKPDNGVGAADTHKITCDLELKKFLNAKPPVNYIMEEFIAAEVNSYDAIIDGDGNPVFETGNITPHSLMDVVNANDNCVFYIVDDPAKDICDAGRRTVKAFGVKNRFVHFEFFRLLSDQHIGKKGEVVALEVNMRPAGGIAPDMMNYANSTDVFKIWADVMAFNGTQVPSGEKYFCGFAGRRNGKDFVYSEQDIIDKYRNNLKIIERVPKALSGTMGDLMFVANFKTEEELKGFYSEVLKTK